jgi:hypothetical protein
MANPLILLAALLSTSVIAPTSNGASTTLPFQRHAIRVNGVYAVAVQQQGSNGRGLELYRSTDAVHWTHDQSIQPNAAIRDTADIVADGTGNGFYLVYGVEPQSSKFGPDPNTKVVFSRYELLPDGTFGLELGPRTLLKPATGQAYFRPSIARDATGELYVAATFFDGTNFSWIVRRSPDGGVTWHGPTTLASFGTGFGGGKVIAYADGNRVAAIYDQYASGAGHMRSKAAGDGGTWGSPIVVAAEGLYHAGAFNVVSTADGRLHLGYSSKDLQQLFYRTFNGTSWSARTLLDPVGIWSNQVALTAQGNTVSFAWNHEDSINVYRIFQRVLTNGTFSAIRVLDATVNWKGYTSAIEQIAPGEQALVIWSIEKALNVSPAFVEDTLSNVP